MRNNAPYSCAAYHQIANIPSQITHIAESTGVSARYVLYPSAMKIKYIKIGAALLFMIAGAGLLCTYAANISWKSGHVVSASISGHGPADRSTSAGDRRKDLWWNYCISSKDQAYSVLSRENPSRSGLKVGGLVRFYEKRNQLFIHNAAGKPIGLKILRKDQGPRCP